MILSVIWLSLMMILLSIVSVIRHLICGNNCNWLLNLNLIYETLRTGAGSGLLISMLEKTQLVWFDGSNNTGAVDAKMDGSILNWILNSPKLDWGSYIMSIAKITSKKIGTLICSMKFLSPEVALYLYKCAIQPCMKYCCHVWAGAPSCYLELLDKL